MKAGALRTDENGRHVYVAPCCGMGIAVFPGDHERLDCPACRAWMRQRSRVLEVLGRRVDLAEVLERRP